MGLSRSTSYVVKSSQPSTTPLLRKSTSSSSVPITTTTTTAPTTPTEYETTMWNFVQELFIVKPSTTTTTTTRQASWMLRFWCLTLPCILLDLVRLLLAVICMAPGFLRFAWYYWMVATHETVSYARDSCRQRLDVYPSSSKAEGAPVVVFCPGGAWMIGYKLWGALLARSLGAFNCCVVMVDYRNFPFGYVPDQVDDLNKALVWTKQNIHKYGGDCNKIVLAGESAGGHLATLLLLQKALADNNFSDPVTSCNNQFNLVDCKGLVTIAAPLDLSCMMETCTKHGMERESLYRLFGGAAQFENSDPLLLVNKCGAMEHGADILRQLPPMRVCQGTRDGTVSLQCASGFVDALRQAQGTEARVALEVYHGWSHTRANVEGPMEGDFSFHRDLWRSVQEWTGIEQKVDEEETWRNLGYLCPSFLVKLGTLFMPV